MHEIRSSLNSLNEFFKESLIWQDICLFIANEIADGRDALSKDDIFDSVEEVMSTEKRVRHDDVCRGRLKELRAMLNFGDELIEEKKAQLKEKEDAERNDN